MNKGLFTWQHCGKYRHSRLQRSISRSLPQLPKSKKINSDNNFKIIRKSMRNCNSQHDFAHLRKIYDAHFSFTQIVLKLITLRFVGLFFGKWIDINPLEAKTNLRENILRKLVHYIAQSFGTKFRVGKDICLACCAQKLPNFPF